MAAAATTDAHHAPAKKRVFALDLIKGVAIVLMVYGHITQVGEWFKYFEYIKVFIYTFHMPIFLLISGYLFDLGENPQAALAVATRRIAIPYVLFLVPYLLLLSYANKIGFATSNKVGALGPFDVLRYVLVKPVGSYWFLHTLFVYQATCAVSRIVGSRFVGEFDLAALIFSLLIYFGVIEADNLLFLLLGFLVRKFSIMNTLSFSSSLGLCVLVFFLFAVQGLARGTIINVFWVPLVLSLLWNVGVRSEGSWVGRLLALVGRNTLVILLVHVYFVNLVKPMSKYLLLIDSTGLVNSILALIVTILGAVLFAKVCDAAKVSLYLFGARKIYFGTLSRGN